VLFLLGLLTAFAVIPEEAIDEALLVKKFNPSGRGEET
jgi:hypothetical protein